MVRVIVLTSFFVLLCACFPRVYHKNILFSQKDIGVNQSNFRVDGYYYRILDDTLYHKYDLKDDGSFDKSKSFYYQLKYLRCLFFTTDGFVIQKDFTTSHIHNIDSVKYYNENLISIFEKKLAKNNSIKGIIGKSDTWLLNEKSQVWNNGVFKIKQDSIEMQLFKNVLGDYYLVEHSGFIGENNIRFTKEYFYREKQLRKDTVKFKFREYKIGQINNYIKENKLKFWRR